jgi:hypothetical protein
MYLPPPEAGKGAVTGGTPEAKHLFEQIKRRDVNGSPARGPRFDSSGTSPLGGYHCGQARPGQFVFPRRPGRSHPVDTAGAVGVVQVEIDGNNNAPA